MTMNLAGSPWVSPDGVSNYAYYEMMAHQAAAPHRAAAERAKSEAQSAYAALEDMQSTAFEIAAERDQWEKWGQELDAKVTYWKNLALKSADLAEHRAKMVKTRDEIIGKMLGAHNEKQSNPANSDAYRALQQELDSVKKHRDECLNWGKGLQQKLETTTQELAITKQGRDTLFEQWGNAMSRGDKFRDERDDLVKSRDTLFEQWGHAMSRGDKFRDERDALANERDALLKERDSLKSQLEATKEDILEVLPRMREYEEAICQMRAFAQACGNVLNKTLPLSAKAQILEQGQNLYTRDPERDARWTQNPLESEGFAKLGQGFVQKLRGWQQQIRSGGGDAPDKTPQTEKDSQQAEGLSYSVT